MTKRPQQLIETLNLLPHPEGGYYREIYRSVSTVQPKDARGARSALTLIYFLLTEGQESRWHKVASDELWHFCEGDPLKLSIADPEFKETKEYTLGAFEALGTLSPSNLELNRHPVHIVPAHHWQSAKSLGTYTLVSCSVAPGFDFADFEMKP